MSASLVAFRVAFGGFMIYSAYNMIAVNSETTKQDINMAISYYTEKNTFIKDARLYNPALYTTLDSLIFNGLALMAIAAGVTIIGGSRIIGGLLSLFQAILSIILFNNIWTPKQDNEEQITNFMMALTQICFSVILLFGMRLEIPVLNFKWE